MHFSDETIDQLQSLLKEADDGSDTAFDQIVSRIEDRLRHLTTRMLSKYPRVRRWEDTDDVFQAALIRLHRSLQKTDVETARGLVGLAATQVRRTLLDLARHYFGVFGIGKMHHTDAQGRAADDPGGPIENSFAETGIGSLEDWTNFHAAAQKLPEEEKEVFNLCWYVGLQQDEVARLLGISRRTVIRRLQRARESLKELIIK